MNKESVGFLILLIVIVALVVAYISANGGVGV